jgi:hypothetical protein
MYFKGFLEDNVFSLFQSLLSTAPPLSVESTFCFEGKIIRSSILAVTSNRHFLEHA